MFEKEQERLLCCFYLQPTERLDNCCLIANTNTATFFNLWNVICNKMTIAFFTKQCSDQTDKCSS